MSEPADAITLELEPAQGRRRRVRIVPRGDRYERVVEERRGCHWHMQGREWLADVTVERGAEVVQ